VLTRVERTRRFEKELDRVPEAIRVKAIVWIQLVETLVCAKSGNALAFMTSLSKGSGLVSGRSGLTRLTESFIAKSKVIWRSCFWRCQSMSTEKKGQPLYSDELRKKYGRITFGRFLVAWREADGFTQAAFARKLSLSAANLCDLEQGRRIPSPSRAKKIAKKLGLPEKGIVAMALEDSLRREGMSYSVELKEVA
jgi:DNA-binding transcriptional regulator YiaG